MNGASSPESPATGLHPWVLHRSEGSAFNSADQFETHDPNQELIRSPEQNQLKEQHPSPYPVLMQEARSAPASTASSFANLLSSLTSPPPQPTEAWDDSDLAPDIATISYEHALRAQTRLKSPANHLPQSTPRTTIVTLRLTKAESAQLHERAAEAGLNVSAYLRSCVFEVETLRTQVREALQQFRSAVSAEQQQSHKPAQPEMPSWRSRLFSLW